MPAPQFNPAYLTDPALYGDQQAIEQQRQLAQLLMTQGLTPSGGTESVGGVAIRRSPLEGVAKLAQLLSGQQMQGQTNLASQGLMQRQAQAMLQMYGSPSGSPGGAPSGQGPALGAAMSSNPQGGPAAAPSTPAGGLGIPGMSPMQAYLASQSFPKEYGEAYMKPFTPNDTSVQAIQGGVDPQMANRLALIKSSTDPKILGMQQAGMGPMQIYQAIYGEAAKNAEVSRRPGEGYSNSLTGEAGMVGKIPEGANIIGSPGPNGQVSLAPMPGNAGVLASNTAATAAGTNSQTPTTAYGPDGQPIYSTKGQDVRRANQVDPADQAARDAEGLRIVQSEYDKATDPTVKSALGRELQQRQARSGAVTPELPPGTAKGAQDAQGTLTKRYSDLQDQASVAQTTTSYLQSIKELANKAATGQFTDKLQFANSLLSQLPGASERATDAVTANNLLDKYSNQIVARLGQGGLGTDAARSILQSAYPNAKMSKDAIAEAADNLMGANAMVQAKARVLSPAGNARDPVKYQQTEQVFDQNADPRVWQFATLVKTNPAEAAKFAAKVKAQDPTFSAKIRALQGIGAL